MKLTYVEYGETVSKNYQSKRLTLGAEVGAKETADGVLARLKSLVQDYLSEKKQKANKLRKLADNLDAGLDVDFDELQDEF